ncbi:MAG: YbaK/EbsC family protein [Alphaproteobacteria bacterium]|nr:YbaK/EbsC family protein [Alphaproteobacteria bacterium]
MPLKPAAQRVEDLLAAQGMARRVVEFPESTRSSAEAAAAIGCALAQIAKSLVFKAASGRPVLVVASGVNRIDEKKIKAAIGQKIGRADADYVRERTGYAIGGVAPLGHAQPSIVLIDRDLLALDPIWAAAGTPNAVFRLSPGELVRISGGEVADVKQDT